MDIWMCNPQYISTPYFSNGKLKPRDIKFLTQSHPVINTLAHTGIPWSMLSLLKGPDWNLGAGGGWWQGWGTEVCTRQDLGVPELLSQTSSSLLPGHGRMDPGWVRPLLSSHWGWLTQSHNGQWGRGRERGLNFPWPFPSLTSSLIVYFWHLRSSQCQCIWKPIVACVSTLVSPLCSSSAHLESTFLFPKTFDILLKT